MSEIAFRPMMDVDAFTGRMNLHGLSGRGATLSADTRCQRCGLTPRAGESWQAHLAENFDYATWEHLGPCPIKAQR